MQEISEILQKLTNKKFNYLTKRGNDSILKSLKIAKKLGYKKVYIADQGGWITYKHFPKRLKLELNELKSDYGIIKPNQIIHLKNSIILLNSMPAYIKRQPLEKIQEICQKNNNLLIEDITATIGEKTSGNIVVCSFSKTKPVNYGKLGLLSFNESKFDIIEFKQPEYDKKILSESLLNANNRRLNLQKKAQEVKEKLKDKDIIFTESNGINVIIKFNSEKQKEHITQFCLKNELEYVICPKYIKVLDDAISIEIKKSF